ncbi:MAG: hypothetical protein ABIP97_13840 [Chthoniobacterales bacterium]
MKYKIPALFIFSAALICGCVHKTVSRQAPSVSTSGISSGLDRVNQSISRAKTLAEKIDYKAVQLERDK